LSPMKLVSIPFCTNLFVKKDIVLKYKDYPFPIKRGHMLL
jgi:hypothetical protein